MALQSSKFRYTVLIQEPATGVDAIGQPLTGFVNVKSLVRCSITTSMGDATLTAGIDMPTTSHRFTFRDEIKRWVSPTSRFVSNNKFYNVVSYVDPTGQMEILEVLAKEVLV